MKPFLDLVGASGAVYRFRKVDTALPPTAGNFVYVRENDGAHGIVCCGKARNIGLALMGHPWAEDELAEPGDQLYVRLNVGGGARAHEHEDLIAGLPRPFAIYEIE